MRNSMKMRGGFALPAALLAMMVIGAIVTGGFYASSQESRISASVDLGSQAFYMAEYGLNEAMGTWRNTALAEMTGPVTLPEETVTDASGATVGTYQLRVRRVGMRLYLVSSEGRVQAGPQEAVRRVGAVVRTTRPTLPAPTALAVYGGLTVGGNSNVDGSDAPAPGCVAGDSVAGVTAFDSSLVANQNRDRIAGDPPIDENTSLDTTGLSRFGDVDLQMFIDAADKVYEHGETQTGMGPVEELDLNDVTICQDSVRANWGDPDGLTSCSDYFPVIHAKGDLHLKTGKGQGILIVEGDLQASGNFDFYGVVIVLGELSTSGTGNHMEGAVIVQGDGVLESESTSLGNSLVQYSKCRVDRAFNASLRPRLLSSRAWVDFSAATSGSTTFTQPSS